jgi:hypothetical protein
MHIVITVKVETVTSDGGGNSITNSVIASIVPFYSGRTYPCRVIPFVPVDTALAQLAWHLSSIWGVVRKY